MAKIVVCIIRLKSGGILLRLKSGVCGGYYIG
jgi:hypothetical protein